MNTKNKLLQNACHIAYSNMHIDWSNLTSFFVVIIIIITVVALGANALVLIFCINYRTEIEFA